MKKLMNQIQKLGIDIDRAFDNRDSAYLKECIQAGEKLEKTVTTPNELAILYYYLGNAWSNLDILNGLEASVRPYDRHEHIRSIENYRKCIGVNKIAAAIRSQFVIQAFINLGNMLSNAGRSIYAIELWKKALQIDPEYGMAGCNLSHGLIKFLKCLYDDGHQAILSRYAYKKLNHYIKDQRIYLQAKKAFQNDILAIEQVLNEEYLAEDDDFNEASLGDNHAEICYKKWVLNHALFLNPLNEVYKHSVVSHDVLSLPDMIANKYSAPVYQGFYNQLKQEYITARYFLYQYENEYPEDVHFSDKGRRLVNTLDYTQHGIKYECLKNSFRMSYSIFDKIAYFINDYFELGVSANKVYFKTIWYENKSVKKSIEDLDNYPLRGLFFLSKDFQNTNGDTFDVADPDAKMLSNIRNHLEHKYLKIHLIDQEPKASQDDLFYDRLAFSITEDDFKNKAMKLLRSAREALIYLSLAVTIEEKKRSKKIGKCFSMPLGEFDN
jgi:hypothetical protein